MDIDWSLYRTFLAAVRSGSLSSAARDLRLTQPTVGRHIDSLEAQTGQTLFTRSRHGLHPTEAALALVPHAEAMAAAAAALVREATGTPGQARGTVRLTVSQFVGVEVLPPILTRFRDAQPHIGIELVLSDQPLNLLTREADIAIRMVRPDQGGLVAKQLGTVRIGLFAHRNYVAEHGMPDSLEALRQHRLIGHDSAPHFERALRRIDGNVSQRDFALRTDAEGAQLALLRAGFGIGGCQVPVARADPDLLPVLPDLIGFELEVWRAMHEDMRNSLPVRLMADHLDREVTAYLAGARPSAT